MRKKMSVIVLFIILGIFNYAIFEKEQHLKSGIEIFLQIAPKDPRSLMQGDYMALRFAMTTEISKALLKQYKEKNKLRRDGYAVVQIDDKKTATFKRLYKNQDIADNEMKLHFKVRNGRVEFATDAFFFQEGKAEVYENAKYGLFSINEKGHLLLIFMYDKNLIKLQ